MSDSRMDGYLIYKHILFMGTLYLEIFGANNCDIWTDFC